MNLKSVIITSVVLCWINLDAQDIHFSQTTETPLWNNPSQAGLGHDVRASINYKDQWRSVVSAPYKTLFASADFALLRNSKKAKLGVGISLFNDQAGDVNLNTNMGQLAMSGIVTLNESNFLSAGLSAGYGQRTLNYANLTWGNQYDGLQYNSALASGEPTNFQDVNFFDLGGGISWLFSSPNATLSSSDARMFNIGVAAHHLNKPSYSFYGDNSSKLPMKLVFHGNAAIGMKNTNLILEPSYYVALQGPHREIVPGMMFKFLLGQSSKYTGNRRSSGVAVGAFVRFNDAIVPMVRYEFANWAVATTYDINISDLSAASRARGGFEVSIRFMTPDPFSKRSTNNSFF
jgi:type IX secretion system PorP/SprF family membrane protein